MKGIVTITTIIGDIKIRLFPDIAPMTCYNFVGLIKKGHYNGSYFHRNIPGFMIQGGKNKNGNSNITIFNNKSFKDEINSYIKFDKKGMLAMANSGKDTNTCQFFITINPSAWLNGKHTIFGEVIEGYNIVEKISEYKDKCGIKTISIE